MLPVFYYLCTESDLTEMKVYRILAAASAALLLLAGCTHEMKTAVTADEGKYPMPGGYDASMSYSYDMQYITGGVPKQVMDKVNGYLADRIYFESEDAPADVPEACRLWVDALISDYEADTVDFAEDYDAEESWMFNWSFGISGTFESACKARNWQTYAFTYDDYTGGAHGIYEQSYAVFDMKTGERIQEDDFLDTEAEELLDMIYDRILENLDEDMWDAIYEVPTLNGNFMVDDRGVCWVYNPYEIAPYALGSLDAFLTWDELSPFLIAVG